jgi:beta-glucanase (GH16 family)
MRVHGLWQKRVVLPGLLGLAAAAAAGVSIMLMNHGTQSVKQIPKQPAKQAPKLKVKSVQAPVPVSQTGGFSTAPVWRQNFSAMADGLVDNKVWRYELDPAVPGYNDEVQAYTASSRNVRIEKGRLVLEARREPYVYPSDPSGRQYEITSGRIDTKDSFSFEFGKFEATMKLPKGTGTWPAFWFLSANQPNTSKLHPTNQSWEEPRFYMHDGELDAMEAYGADPGTVEGTVYSYQKTTEFRTRVPDASDAFHTYGVEVTPDKVLWTVDGRPYGEFRKPSDNTDQWPFGGGNRFYPILNLAMGGSGGAPDPAVNSWRLEVSDIRYYGYTPVKP